MVLARTNIYLEPETKKKLEEIAQGLRPAFSVTVSDLVRFALHEVYGIKFRPIHIWERDLKKKIQIIKGKGETK